MTQHDGREREAARISERAAGPGRAAAPAPVSATVDADAQADARRVVRGDGRPLDRSTRQLFERRLGHEFGRVRVHADARAAASARELGALAYTFGTDIVFADGEYRPGTEAGRKLLAHELVHVVQQQRGRAVVQRQRAPTVRQATPAEIRDLVQTTVTFLNSSADHYSDPLVRVDAALFDRVINSWYVMVVEQERMVDSDLGGEPMLKAELHTAYTRAIQVLIRRAAAALGQSEADLWERNTGRIPMWAWPTPHHLEPGISTPIAEGRSADPLTGAVGFAVNGFSVTIDPDSTDASLGDRAETRIDFQFPPVHYEWQQRGRQRVVTRFDQPVAPTVRIQTFFGRGVSATSPSGYGRGTTPEDLAGGRVTPRSTSLGFHEGSHGRTFVRFLEANAAPSFTGSTGMTKGQFDAAISRWHADLRAYSARINQASLLGVDCVGTTIDVFEQGRARRGVRVRIVCGP